jgi:Vitamin K-dependent gamma-carboxylase/DoxX
VNEQEQEARFTGPQPIERLESVRMLAPLAILGFLSSRLIHIEHWVTEVGYVVPKLATRSWKQPLYIPPLPVWLAYLVALATVGSGIATALGYRTRISSGIFAVLLAYLALADRLETFTVNKLGTVVAIALFATPSGARYGIDARLGAQKNSAERLPTHVTWGNVRFFQALLASIYFTSGVAKLHGDWLTNSGVIYSHLHDSYQTALTYFLATSVPVFGWTVFQSVTLIYEVGAPLWFSLKKTRLPALFVGLGMHAAIGLMFGPVIWFSLLMSALLLSCFAPIRWLSSGLGRVWERSG